MKLEHINITVPDAKAHAAVLVSLFDWHVRWQGTALDDGFTVHVGTDDGYLALYSPPWELTGIERRYHQRAGMNHIGVVVDDIEATEARVKAAGFTTHSHADYEPGRRFYFDGPDDVEYEVVSYA
ncbi:VOC family protein [Roseobacter sp.]|uniref:VOC family protein n=1 Tax=Roseobacter sp. TaxID=1907202 RepID=UPI003297DDEA